MWRRRQTSPPLPHSVCTEPAELRASNTIRRKNHQRILKHIEEANLRSKKGSSANPYQASHKQIIPFMSENISYLDDQWRSKEKRHTSPFTTGRFYFKRELPLVLFNFTSFTPDPTQEHLCWTLLHLQLYRNAQDKRDHIYVYSGAICPSAGHGSGTWKLTKVLQLPMEVGSAAHKRKLRRGKRAFPASCWQTISVRDWPIFYRIISSREWSTAAL